MLAPGSIGSYETPPIAAARQFPGKAPTARTYPTEMPLVSKTVDYKSADTDEVARAADITFAQMAASKTIPRTVRDVSRVRGRKLTRVARKARKRPGRARSSVIDDGVEDILALPGLDMASRV